MSRYGKGWKPSPANAPRKFGSGIKYAAGDLPSSHMLTVPSDFPLNQGQTQSCVAHATAACLRILSGQPLASRRFLYGVARIQDGEVREHLLDDGCVPSDMVAAVGIYGACLESDLPWDPSKINDPPPWNVLRVASAYRVTGWERLPDDATRIDAMKRALVAGHPVMFGSFVGPEYESWSGPAVYPGLRDIPNGGHMQVVCGFRDDLQAVRVLNSWGPGWGDGGYSWTAYDWIADSRCTDLYALDAVPLGLT